MSSFDRIKSGITGLDEVVDSIRIGDNVVWQVDTFEEYQFVVNPFVTQCLEDHRNLVYMRFANHPPLIEEQEGVTILEFQPEDGFETFTTKVQNAITRIGKEAFYVFDSLSNLQVAWATDLMMANFFRVTCPYLFEMDTVAYFPVTRGEHASETIEQIRHTTQLLINIYSGESHVYMQPSKVWHRFSETMFAPHIYNKRDHSFRLITDTLRKNRFQQLVTQSINVNQSQNLDSWDRFIVWAKLEYKNGRFSEETRNFLCDTMMGVESHVKDMLYDLLTPRDYFLIQSRIIGSGSIGGKACGMILARKLIQKHLPEAAENMEPHDSFYLGSDVFYTYIVHNGYWKQRLEQKTREGFFPVAKELRQCFKNGIFPRDIRKQFRRMLEYYGDNPIVVRSSSLQEDGFGNAFAGKYKSVFCMNTGTMDEKLEEFENAVRTVYSSTMDRAALEYRRQRGLEKDDEQMAVMIQRVAGENYDGFFMPHMAGVGYSHSAYKWDPQMDTTQGMLRLVMGLGTRAVDRNGEYPRIVSLDRPDRMPLTGTKERHRYSQHIVDVLDYETKSFHGRSLAAVIKKLPPWLCKVMLEHDTDAETMYRERGERKNVYFASCHGIVNNESFISDMKQVLRMLQEQYHYPVDIEFSVFLTEEGSYAFNILQCRPLQMGTDQGKVTIPELPRDAVFFDVRDSSMGGSRQEKLDRVLEINPLEYYRFPYNRKYEIVRAIGEINDYFHRYYPKDKMMLMVPGRIGTSSPDLGVPVGFGDITQFRVICEISDRSTGYMPELSYGSHMFQYLIESNSFYTALLENRNTVAFNRRFLAGRDNQLLELFPEFEKYADVIKITDVSKDNLVLYADLKNERTLCGVVKEV